MVSPGSVEGGGGKEQLRKLNEQLTKRSYQEENERGPERKGREASVLVMMSERKGGGN